MPQADNADLQRRRRRFRSTLIATVLRCALVVLIAALLRVEQSRVDRPSDGNMPAVDPAVVRTWLPAASRIESGQSLQTVFNDQGAAIGAALTTLPAARSVIGYRGPSNVLIVLDERATVIGARLLSSEDTPEHVEAILQDETFFGQFRGWTLGQPDSLSAVDAVSGATLTSLAMIEGITLAMGADRPSLKFPDGLTNADLALVGGADLQLLATSPYAADLVDSSGAVVGRLLRSGPLVDSIPGYQGPSEVLIRLTADGTTDRIALRNTYDNQPYAGYLNQEKYFWKVFRNQPMAQVAKIDLEQEQVEGVSGATMTSMAVAQTILAAAAELERRQTEQRPQTPTTTLRWSSHDIGTLVVLGLGMLINLTRLKRRRWLQRTWNVILVVYFGLVTGNLISLAVVSGWAMQGVAWRLAPGLASVVVVSFLLNAVAGRNIYCSHICPHGALQQLIRRRPQHSEWFKSILRKTTWIPGVTLLLAVIATWWQRDGNLAAWEPFNAYIWYVAGGASLTVAAVSIVWSWYVPMGYCRHACGTGRLLDYVRRSAQSARFTVADGIAVGLAVAIAGKLLTGL
ncbi:MAG: FMN-binding protein [Planctomycetaceae bacterium]|nr:FMN-binding protein [Planctomycetaceae bacterium]